MREETEKLGEPLSEFQSKICKKLAQLTRVVFEQHLASEEVNARISLIRAESEKSLNLGLSSGTLQVKSALEKIKQLENGSKENIDWRSFENRLENDRKRLDLLVKNMDEEVKNMKDNNTEELQTAVATIRNKFEQARQKFKEDLLKSEAKLKLALRKKKKKWLFILFSKSYKPLGDSRGV